MIYITGWLLKYKCFNCNHAVLIEMAHENINGMKRVLALGNEFRRCPLCQKETFRMIDASISRSETIFGEPGGTWKCPNHLDRYYPYPLQRGFDILEGRIEGFVVEHYKEIARLGLPFKCPKCQTVLKYYRGDQIY